MGVSAVYGLVTLATTAVTVSQQQKAASQQKDAANNAKVQADAQAAGAREAAVNAQLKDKAAAAAQANQALATDQLKTAVDVTTDDAGDNPAARKRTVAAQFNVADAGVGSATSIRV